MGSKIIMVAVAVIAACAFAGFLVTRGDGEQVWWIFTDPHVFPGDERYLRTAIADVNELQIADYAICLGDLANNSHRSFPPIAEMMENLKVRGWYYVLGNHDFDRDTGEAVLPLSYRGIDVAGIRFVLISDEKGWENYVHYGGGVMGDEQFDWLWAELHTNRDKPIFVFSHQPYYQWNVWSKLQTAFDGDVAVDVWFHGHLHQWVLVENTPYGFMSFGVNSIDWNKQYESIFLFIKPKGGEVEVEIRARNHLEGVWLEEPHYKLTFKASKTRAASMGINPLTAAPMLAATLLIFLLAFGGQKIFFPPKHL